MLEMIMFAVIFTVVQTIGGFIVFNLMMSESFMKRFIKKYVNLAKAIVEEIEELS